MSAADGAVLEYGDGPTDWLGVIGGLSEAVVATDTIGRVLYVNAAFTSLLGWAPDDLIGTSLAQIVPDRLRASHLESFDRFVSSGKGHLLGRTLRVPALRQDGTEMQVDLVVNAIALGGRPAVVGLLRDSSDRIELEGPGDLADRLVASLAEARSLEEAWPRVLAALAESLNWELAQLWLVDESKAVIVPVHTWARPDSKFGTFLEASGHPLPRGVDLPGRAWATRDSVWLTGPEANPHFPRAPDAAAVGLRSGFVFPLVAAGRIRGVIELFSAHCRHPDPNLEARLAALGRELGWFLDRRASEEQRLALLDAERAARAAAEAAQARLRAALEHAAELATTLQRSLMPLQLPVITGVQIGAQYRPAGRGTEVGGDFYDVFRLGRDSWGVVIGDVCGKGAEAATVTAFARYTIRAAAMQTRSPARALAMLNEAMVAYVADGGPDLFATAVLARLRPRPGAIDISLASGGHPLPLVRRASSGLEVIGRPGLLLGAFDSIHAHDAHCSLGPGDMLVLVTDGVLEARRGSEELGESGLAELVSRLGAAPPDQVAGAIVAAAVEFQAGPVSDDIAVIVIAPG